MNLLAGGVEFVYVYMYTYLFHRNIKTYYLIDETRSGHVFVYGMIQLVNNMN